MFKKVKILLVIIFIPVSLFAQDWNEIYYMESDAEYFLQERDFKKAIRSYEKILDDVPESANIKYKLGKTYLETDDQKNLAIEFLKQATEKASNDFDKKSIRELRAPVEAYLYLGIAYQIQNNIDQASEAYKKYKELINSGNSNYNLVNQKIKSCENAKLYMKQAVKLNVENLGDKINDQNSNFGAVVSGDEQTIIFTSYTSNYIDIYSCKKTNGLWGTPKKITDNVSKKYFIKTSSISFDGTELYLVSDDPENNDIFVSHLEGKTWTNAEKLDKTINGKKSNETHASVSKDGNTLYFTSDREGGMGGLDIYKSTKDSKGSWGVPENLGQSVNTEFNEETPFVTPDGKYLFFSSEGHNSMGGFDIFYVDLASKSQVINMGYPVNSTDDDLFFVPGQSINSGYISRLGEDTKGLRDIYHLTVIQKIKFAGNIKNIDGESISDAEFNISISELETNNVVQTLNSDNGQFNFEIDPGKYIVTINNENFENYSNEFIIPDNYSDAEFSFEALLNPLKIEQEELIAEVVEPPVVVPPLVAEVVVPIEEVVVEEPVVEVVIEEPIQEVKEEKVEEPVIEKEEPIVQEVIEEKTEVIEVTPVQEIQKYTPVSTTVSGSTTYSVQLMALKNPVDVDYFKNVDNVRLTKYPDGYYRYTVGITNSFKQAEALKEKIHTQGYKDAFIRINEHSPNYTIQIMALIIPVNLDHFKDLSSVAITKGDDDYFRYTIGSFNTYEEAKQELSKLNTIGYNQAFIKEVVKDDSLAVN